MAQILKNIYGHKPQLKKLLKAKRDNHLPHALLFAGPSGIGRKKAAWALAQTLLCKEQDPACGECVSCISVEREKNQHILFIHPDGLYIKVDSIRQVSQFLSLQSFAPARIIIIDSAHQMNLQAANSLLKILEEPPLNVYFILISSHLLALPVTIRSRVQIMRFLPLKPEDLYNVVKASQTDSVMETELKKKVTVKSKGTQKSEEVSLMGLKEEWLVRASHGSMDNLEKWIERKELRDQAFDLMEKAVIKGEFYSLGDLTGLVKDRNQALFVCLCWQQILRDARIMQLGSKDDVIHQDQQGILNILKKVSSEVLDDFFQRTVQLEQDLKAYLDSSLAFDNLFLYLRSGSLCKKDM